MILALRYFFIVLLFGLMIIFFNLFVNIYVYLDYYSCFLCKEFEEPDVIYDYIIVGSGTAGSVITLRLTKEKNDKILLLEAGPSANFLFDIPALIPLLQKTAFDWQYETVPQEFSCKAFKNNASSWPMGKIVGGSHMLNNMLYVPPNIDDIKELFPDNFNKERDIQYYLKTAEQMSNAGQNINNLSFSSDLGPTILKAAKELNISGFSLPRVTTRDNKRWTTSHSLLEQNPSNLKIITNALVIKILFKNRFEAYAIKYHYLGVNYIIKAKKGIILSAGVIGTPKLLLQSGVGAGEQLNHLKIKLIKQLPVGENLQDHLTTGLDLITLNQTLSINLESLLSPISAYKYFWQSDGPWTTVGCEAIGFFHVGNHSLLDNNLQYMVLNAGVSSDGGKHLRNTIGVKNNVWDNYFAPLVGRQIIGILPIVVMPKSRGTVRLKSKNPFDKPLINPNYLVEQQDVNILVEGIALLKKFISTSAMQKIGAKLYTRKFPGCENFNFDSKPYWECYIRHFSLTSYHPCCTCKMGSNSDPSSVVNYNFQVIGTNKLYVADASVFPAISRANPNAAIMILAEMAVDAIKTDQYLLKGVCRKKEMFVKANLCYNVNSKKFINDHF